MGTAKWKNTTPIAARNLSPVNALRLGLDRYAGWVIAAAAESNRGMERFTGMTLGTPRYLLCVLSGTSYGCALTFISKTTISAVRHRREPYEFEYFLFHSKSTM